MTIFFVLRRSDEEQLSSLDTQRASCEAFRTARGFKDKVVELVSDGISGDDVSGLASIRRALEGAKRGDVVITRDRSRLGRDMLESAMTIRTLVADRKADLYYYATGEEVHSSNAMQTMMNVFRGFSAQSELENIRSRTREAIRARVKAGKIAGGKCYGYSLVRLADGTTVAIINETEAEVIRRIFQLFVSGHGLKRIAVLLNDEKVPSPVAGKRGSGSWAPGAIREIVRRERYRGMYVHGVVNRKKQGGKRIKVFADPADVMRVEIPEWRIVDDVTWKRAPQVIEARATEPTVEENPRQYLFSGLARCAECGGAISTVRNKMAGGLRMTSYGCAKHKSRGNSVCSMATTRPTEVIDAAIIDALQKVLTSPDVVGVIMAAVQAEVEERAVEAGSVDTTALEAELVQTKKEHRNLVRLLSRMDEEDETGTAEVKERGQRIKELEKRLHLATRAPIEAAAIIAEAQEVCSSEAGRPAHRYADGRPEGCSRVLQERLQLVDVRAPKIRTARTLYRAGRCPPGRRRTEL